MKKMWKKLKELDSGYIVCIAWCLFILPTLIGLTSCGPSANETLNEKNTTAIFGDSVANIDEPKLICTTKTGFGKLHIYSYHGDTLYVAEGTGSSYPVSLTIKEAKKK